MKKLVDIKTKSEMEKFVDKIVGDNRECEKNLLMAVALFMKSYCPTNEQDCEHMIQMLLSTKVCKQMRHPMSDFDNIMLQVEIVEPDAPCLVYYDAYKMYPEGVANQAAGNLVYRLAKKKETWPKRFLGKLLTEKIDNWKPAQEWTAKPIESWIKPNDNPVDKDEDDFDFF